jgi:hypothetical protein
MCSVAKVTQYRNGAFPGNFSVLGTRKRKREQEKRRRKEEEREEEKKRKGGGEGGEGKKMTRRVPKGSKLDQLMSSV